jgi:pimeloyl-ACP methyl ester carboxylesterase
MRTKLLLFISILFINISYSQVGKSPYPIIFVHGLNSGEYTWDSALTRLRQSWNIGNSYNLNFVLNARGGDTTNYVNDVIIPLLDENGYVVNTIDKSSLYTINFNNFWNRNINDPRIFIHDNGYPENSSKSNQSAIYKQGYALSICIDSVLRVTGAEKVILVGHSMGGLAIREYLQRKENGIHKWWVNPSDEINGHKVAKVLTMSTPHLGSNHLFEWIVGINSLSEAMRDLKYSYPVSFGIPAPYLFSNSESNIPHDPPTGFLNTDVNCNGYTNDYIEGISNGTSYSSAYPLPDNINYTWLVSKFTTDGDGCVDIDKQWLYDANGTPQPVNLSDTMLTNRPHVDIPFFQGVSKDIVSIIRGLDEPNSREFAYKISLDTLYSGFISMQPFGIETDLDFYKVTTTITGNLVVNLNSNNAGVNRFEILSSSGTVLVTKNVTNTNESILYNGDPGDYYIKIVGYSYDNPNMNNYSFVVTSIPQINIGGLVAYYPFEGNANDLSGNNFNGTIANNCIFEQGIKGNGLRVYGQGINGNSGGHVLLPNMNLTSMQNFSISLWIKEESFTWFHGESYISFGDATAGTVYIGHYINPNWNTDELIFGVREVWLGCLRFPYDYTDRNTFINLALVYDNGVLRGYKNAILLDTLVTPINLNSNTAALGRTWFWNYGETCTRLNGVLDEVRIYNRALSLTDILSLYDYTLPVELMYFSSLVSSNNVNLQWSTSSEINNAGFDVERKFLDKKDWNKIGFVVGNGNCNEHKDFSFTDIRLSTGKYNYRIKQIDYNGNYKYYYLSEAINIGAPEKFFLSQNYPNPFNTTCIIQYDIAKQCLVKIIVYDLLGREIKTLVNESLKPGIYEASFDGSQLSSGIYFYKIQSGDFSETKKMILIK